MSKTKNIYFVSLGCPRNFVDTEEMLGIVSRAGYEIVTNEKEAGYIVVNTCAFLKIAREESIETINELTKNKKAKIIVAGCMVKEFKEELKKIDGIDYLLGSGDIDKIVELIKSEENIISKSNSYLSKGPSRTIATPSHYAYLKIAEGCAKRCSYCLIPKIKGPIKSKSIEQVVSEFKDLLDQGVKEVILIAQDLGDFGKDTKTNLNSLLKELLKDKRDFWLRLMYLYPDEIDDELISTIKSDDRICNYLDMPIQHVNDEILKKMKRNTSKKEVTEVITKLKKKIPDIIIRTSFIVGFPGETKEQFEELLSFIEDYPLDNIGIFQYSQEEGTEAAKMPHQISEDVKENRYEKIMEKQQEIVSNKNRTFTGQKMAVLVENHHPESNLLLYGRHYGQAPDIDGIVIINDWEKVEKFGEKHVVEITDSATYDLVGKVIERYKK